MMRVEKWDTGRDGPLSEQAMQEKLEALGYTVLYDVAQRKRIKEYRYDDVAFANSGVAQTGGYFLGINYARMARLRRVTGYRGASDWTKGVDHPEDDGIFRIEIASGEKELIVSF